MSDKPPGHDISVSPNYNKAKIWISVGDKPRKLISPAKARAMADDLDEQFSDEYDDWEEDGYDTGLADRLRTLADDVA